LDHHRNGAEVGVDGGNVSGRRQRHVSDKRSEACGHARQDRQAKRSCDHQFTQVMS
jgi:hypothetical protein